MWGTDKTVWADASPAHHLRKDAPPMLVLYADGDDEWRRQQNVEMAQVLKATGAANVDVALIGGRTHNRIWSKVAEPNDEAADRIIQFVRANTTARGSR